MEFHRQLGTKMRRDGALLNIISSRFSAESYHAVRDIFTLAQSAKLLYEFDTTIVPKFQFHNESVDSFNTLLRENNKNPRHQPSHYHQSFVDAVSDFQTRFRASLADEGMSARGQREQFRKTSDISTKTATSKFLMSYRPPTPLRNVPFEEPRLAALKSLKRLENRKLSDEADPNSVFGSPELRKHLNLNPLESAASVGRYIRTACGIGIPITLTPATRQSVAENVSQTWKHAMKRNIAAFVAQMAGLELSSEIPLLVKGPEIVEVAIIAVLTIFTSLRSSKLAHYCDVIPFPATFPLDGPDMLQLRSLLFSRILEKCPKLCPESRPALKPSSAKLGVLDLSDDVSIGDVYVTSLLLPLAIPISSVVDFLRDEIKVDIVPDVAQ
jgi:hypothetical protein